MNAACLTRELLVLAVVCGCAAHSTDVSVPQQPLPTSFSNGSSGPSAASLNWRSYFTDPLLKAQIESAVGANFDVLMALQRVEAARAQVRRATGALLPQVSVVAGVGLQKYGRYTVEGAGNAGAEIAPGRRVRTHVSDFSVGLQSSWEIDAWGKLRNQREASVLRFLSTLDGMNLVVTGLVSEMAVAYLELLTLDATRDVLAQTVVRQQQVLELVRLQKLAGRANELAVQQFEAQVAGTKAMLTEVERRISESENGVNLLRGAFPGPVLRAKAGLLQPLVNNVSTGLPSDLLKHRPDVRAAEFEMSAAKCDLLAARAAFFPSFQITAGVGLQAFDPRFLVSIPESLTYSALAGLVAPVVNRAGIEAEFDTAKAAQIHAMYNYQKIVLGAYVEVVNGLADIQAKQQVVTLKEQQRAAVDQAVETADTLYRAGKASYLEVLLAQQNTLSVELELIAAQRDRQLASVVIYNALGGGWR